MPDHLQTFLDAEPFPGIEPVAGWHLCYVDKPDSDGGTRRVWIARSGSVAIPLRASPTRFTPSQARFAWLVGHEFPVDGLGLWDDTSIEHAMALEGIVA